MFKSQYSRF